MSVCDNPTLSEKRIIEWLIPTMTIVFDCVNVAVCSFLSVGAVSVNIPLIVFLVYNKK